MALFFAFFAVEIVGWDSVIRDCAEKRERRGLLFAEIGGEPDNKDEWRLDDNFFWGPKFPNENSNGKICLCSISFSSLILFFFFFSLKNYKKHSTYWPIYISFFDHGEIQMLHWKQIKLGGSEWRVRPGDESAKFLSI